MTRIPFTVYDFFAYLSSGGLVVAAVDYTFGYQWLLLHRIGLPLGLLLTFLAYISGHVVAHFSSFFLEQLLVHRLLRSPSRCLLGEGPPQYLSRLFPGYYRALPAVTRERIRQRAASMGAQNVAGESLFLHAYAVVARDKDSQDRLDEFRNLYGFARNMTLSFMVTFLVFLAGTSFRGLPPSGVWSLLSLGFGVVMLYRYLKFFRQFSYQLLITYAELPRRLVEQSA